MLKPILFGVLNFLSFLFIAGVLLLILTGISAVGLGIPLSQADCPIQAWLFVLGVIIIINIVFFVCSIPNFLNDVKTSPTCNKVHGLFLIFLTIWLPSGFLLFGERHDSPSCEGYALMVYDSVMILSSGLYCTGVLIFLLGNCFKMVYQKEGQGAIEEPLVPPVAV